MRTIKVIICFSLISGVFMFQLKEVHTQSVIPPACKTSAPGETNCGDPGLCHNTTANTGPGSITISFSGANVSYIPESTYQITVTVSQAGISKFGFEATALDSNDNKAGEFSIIDPNNTSMPFPDFCNPERQYVGHHFAGTNNTWTVSWKAPDHNIGPVTFYAAGNASNGNFYSSGDQIYTTSLSIKGEFGTSIADLQEGLTSFEVQNLATTNINLKYELNKTAHISIILFDLSGKLIQSLWNGEDKQGAHVYSFPIKTSVNPGLYLLQFKTGSIQHTEKILIQ